MQPVPSALQAVAAIDQPGSLKFQLDLISKEMKLKAASGNYGWRQMAARKIKRALEIAIHMHSSDAGNLLFDALDGPMELRKALSESTGG